MLAQDIIQNQEEKDNIDKEYPDSYNVALPYSTKKNKKYWYICPRYWCIKPGENRPLSEEDVKDGKCDGKLIPKGVRTPPPGHYIYEFTDDKEHKNKDGSYRNFYPGFLDTKSHPKHCVPCCFKKFYSDQQINRRKECNINDNDLSGDIKGIYELEQKDKKVIVAVGGLSRSGKSTLVKFLTDQLKSNLIKVVTISLDDWILPIEGRRDDMTVRDRYQYEKISSDLSVLLKGGEIRLSPYNMDSRGISKTDIQLSNTL